MTMWQIGRCRTCGGHSKQRIRSGPIVYHINRKGTIITSNRWRTWFHNPTVADLPWLNAIWLWVTWMVSLPVRVMSHRRALRKAHRLSL